jgi:hypothetical protein
MGYTSATGLLFNVALGASMAAVWNATPAEIKEEINKGVDKATICDKWNRSGCKIKKSKHS